MPITSKPHGPFSVRLLKGGRNVSWNKKGHIMEREILEMRGGSQEPSVRSSGWEGQLQRARLAAQAVVPNYYSLRAVIISNSCRCHQIEFLQAQGLK